MNIEKLWSYKDHRGVLTPVSFEKCPFVPKRIFTVTEVPENCVRGGHAHRTNRQFLICVQGSITVTKFNGVASNVVHLTQGEAILIQEMIWDTQKFNTGQDVLLVLCSNEYDESDYIREMGDYLRITGGDGRLVTKVSD